MNFSWWFSQKIAFGKSKKNKLSAFIIFIGQLAVAIGIIVSLITISTGFGAKKAIKQKLADFNGHIVIQALNSNASFNSDSISIHQSFYPKFNSISEVDHIQAFATKSGVIRTKENFEGVVLKGVESDFDSKRFQKFITKGTIPSYSKDKFSQEVILSEKIARELKLDVDSTFLMYFLQNNSKPLYRRFKISGLYRTDIKFFDDIYLIGDLKQVQRLNRWDSTKVGGFEVFLKDIEKLPIYETEVNNIIPYNIQAESASSSFQQVETWIQIFDHNVWLIVIIMLVVVVINMIMVLLILIVERTPSIGILKTLGTSNHNIQQIFIFYTIFIMLPGLIIGNLIGLGLLLFQHFTGFVKLPSPENYFLSEVPVYLGFDYILLINFLMILVSGIILLIPSLLITKISPAKAVKFN